MDIYEVRTTLEFNAVPTAKRSRYLNGLTNLLYSCFFACHPFQNSEIICYSISFVKISQTFLRKIWCFILLKMYFIFFKQLLLLHRWEIRYSNPAQYMVDKVHYVRGCWEITGYHKKYLSVRMGLQLKPHATGWGGYAR